ncbi:unnamed protein product, partial [Dicrocoelium dendriticum]
FTTSSASHCAGQCSAIFASIPSDHTPWGASSGSITELWYCSSWYFNCVHRFAHPSDNY